ncbi:hypothetical protein BDW59DRAFT_89498 [Aspergillus cavernicola]|uniref:Proteophosphoglycan 5 n=1 Tax=Aspergillus cavernicola TaxID=176166 RepID=A0ABR4I8B1_9EURO
MSPQSPTPLTPKGPRNSRRNQKTSAAQNASTLATPPSSPPRAVSPRGAATDSSNTINFSKKKGSRSAKKPRDVSTTSPVNKTGHRHTSSHPNNNINTPQLKDTRYAGPTFHASPAPSALPIPSFISKSFPESDIAPTLEPDSDSFDVDPEIDNTPSKPKPRSQDSQKERESIPIDWFFKAAVEHRKGQPQQSPELSPRIRSPQTDSKAVQQRKFNTDTAGMFPLEMGCSDLHSPPIGPSFAPSYKDRMNALRSASSPSPNMQELEDERKAKTAVLKDLILNPRPQRPSSVFHSTHNHVNNNQERPMVPHFATPLRTSSGPPIINPHSDSFGTKPPHSGTEPRPIFHHTHFNPPQHHRLQDSTFGLDVLASTPGNAPGTPRQAYDSPNAAYSRSKFQQNSAYYHPPSKSPASYNVPASASSPAFDTKKMEDDLRRILKLDANPGVPSNGIQSSLA